MDLQQDANGFFKLCVECGARVPYDVDGDYSDGVFRDLSGPRGGGVEVDGDAYCKPCAAKAEAEVAAVLTS